MMSHTPGPWLIGCWVGRCHIPVDGGHRHGQGLCQYDDQFHHWDGDEFYFPGITTAEKVDVVWTEYDSLKIRPDDARLIAAAPELLDACKAALPLIVDYVQGRPDVADLLEAAIRKAENTESR